MCAKITSGKPVTSPARAQHLGAASWSATSSACCPISIPTSCSIAGGGYRSALAADSLSRMGYRRVRSLAGGYRGWTASGHAIATEPRHIKALPLAQHIVVAIDLRPGKAGPGECTPQVDPGRQALLSALIWRRPSGAGHRCARHRANADPPSMEAYALEGLPTDWAERINEARMRAASHEVQALVGMCEAPWSADRRPRVVWPAARVAQ